jgi:hypothetical protein
MTSRKDLLVELQARLVAQQMFMRSVLTAALLNTPDPLSALEEMRWAEVLTAQKGARPTGAYEDEVWARALDAFHYELNQVATRIEDQLRVPSTGLANDLRPAPTDAVGATRLGALQDA